MHLLVTKATVVVLQLFYMCKALLVRSSDKAWHSCVQFKLIVYIVQTSIHATLQRSATIGNTVSSRKNPTWDFVFVFWFLFLFFVWF